MGHFDQVPSTATPTLSPIRMSRPPLTIDPAFPTATPKPNPRPFVLSGRNPSNLDVIHFVFDQHDLPYEEPSQQPSWGEFPWSYSRQEKDVNADGLPEIILLGHIPDYWAAYFAILAYDQDSNAWRELFYTYASGKWSADFEFKSDEDHFELDSFVPGGGTGITELTWERTWLKCNEDTCKPVWKGMLYRSFSLYGTAGPDGEGINNEYWIASVQRVSLERIELTTRHFGVVHLPYRVDPPPPTKRIIHPEIRELYQWNGSEFSLAERYQTSAGSEISREFDQMTGEAVRFVNGITCQPLCWVPVEHGFIYDSSKWAAMWSAFWGMPQPGSDDSHWPSEGWDVNAASRDSTGDYVAGVIVAKDQALCRLTVQHFHSGQFELIGRTDLDCTPNFTHIHWIDIDRGGKDELLLLTMPPEPRAPAIVQQLHIYRADKALTEMAQVSGYVNGADGAGIKFNNTQNDFLVLTGVSLEDIARACDGVFSCIEGHRFQPYRWDIGSNSILPVK